MELSLRCLPCTCETYRRRVYCSPSLGKLLQSHAPSPSNSKRLVQVAIAQNGITGLGAYRSVNPGKHSSFQHPPKLRVVNAAASFDSDKSVATMEGYEEHTHDMPDQHIKFLNLIHGEDSNGAKEGLKGIGGVWPETDTLERSKDLGDYLEQLQDFHVKVEIMIEQGDRETASVLVKANFEALMEQVDQGIKGLEQAAMLDILIQLSMSLQDAKAVRQMLGQMKDILVNVEVHEPLLDAFLEHMGSVYFALGNKEEALFCYKRSLDIQESLLGENSPQLVSTLLGLAGTYTDPGERETGKALYKRIISILERSKGTTCEELGAPLLHLGYMLLEDKNPEEAELCIRRALNLAEENNAKGGGSIGVATCGLARVKYAKGDHAKAAALYQSGLNILKNSGCWSNGDVALENVQMEVAEFFSIVGRTKDAQELWEEILHEKEKLVGVNSPRLVVHLQNLATSYAQDGKFEKCEPLLRRSLKLITTSLGPTAAQVSIPLEFLATTLHHLKQNKEAESLARQALNIRENNFPEDDPLIGEACNILASILHANSKNHEALKFAWKALHIREKHLGNNSMELSGTLDLLLELLDSLGKTEEALPLLNRLEGLIARSNKAAP